MASGGGGGSPDDDGGGRRGGRRPRFVKQVLFGPGFNMGAISLGSDSDQESMELSPEEMAAEGEVSSSQLATASQQTEDPLSHYVPDDG